MKSYVLWCIISFISLNGLSHANYLLALQKRFKRTGETSTQLGLGSKEKEALQEALQILNMGKHSLNLPTEDTQLLLHLADVSSNDTDKSDQIEKFVEGPSDDHFSANGKQYLALSGDDKKVHIDNFSIVTSGPEEASTYNNVEVQDVFKMVVRKKVPGSKNNAVHKISIIETNRVEPLAGMEYPQSKRRRRKDIWSLENSLSKPRVRKKRTKRDKNPLLRFIRGDFSANDIDEIFADKGTSDRHTLKTRNLLEKDKFNGNKRIRKRNFEDKGHVENKYHETPPWMRSQYRLELLPERDFRTENFHTKRNENKHRIFRTPLDDLQSSNWPVWRHPLKLKSLMDDEYVDDVLKTKTSNSDKSIEIEKTSNYEGLGDYFVTPKAPHITSRSKTTRTHLAKHSHVKKQFSSVSPNSNTYLQTYSTESGTTLQHEKSGLVPDIVIDKYALEKSIIFPSEGTIKETKTTSILEVAIVALIGILCFTAVFFVCSFAVRWHSQKTCCSTLELKGAQVTVNIHDDSFSDDLIRRHQLPFKSHTGLCYRKMAAQEDKKCEFDLPDFEWHSEIGEWLSDQGSVREAIAFEEL